jgi:redox-sensing transcriptional repressor
MKRKIPRPVIQRLPIYYRVLLETRGTDYIRSQDISESTKFGTSQIRRDLSYFGQFGITGRGYPIRALEAEIRKILGIDTIWYVAIVGIGNLGTALLNYKGFREQGFEIVAGFDVDRRKVNRARAGIKIFHINVLKNVLKEKNIKIAILTVPGNMAQEVADMLLKAGIEGILNFTPVKLRHPERVRVLNIDMTIELRRLAYLLESTKSR